MLLKLIAFAAAAIPVILFVRAMLFRRPTRVSAAMGEFKKQVDLAIWIFLGLIGCVVAFAAGKLAWTWWTAL
jgi:multisubunit Na+/H+ antiporter MnhB subunit